MKSKFISFLFLFLPFEIFSQVSAPQSLINKSFNEGNNSINKLKKTSAVNPIDTIYLFDFSQGLPTGWVLNGVPSAALWEYRGPNTNPNNTVGSQGAYTGNTGPIASPSAANGFMIFDSDYLDNNGIPGNFGNGSAPVDPTNGHSGSMVSAPLDFTNQPNVSFSLQSYMRVFASAALVTFSYDGGQTFEDTLLLHSDLEINTRSENPVNYLFNISSFVGGKSNVVVAFVFDGTNPLNYFANGLGYYFWQLDDIIFYETPKNDLALSENFIENGNKLGVYHTTPITETESVIISSIVKNRGTVTQTNISTITNYFFDSLLVGNEQINATSLASNKDTLMVGQTGYLPNMVGNYQSEIYVQSDSTDYDSTNNSKNYDFAISDSVYALDHGIKSFYLGTNSFVGGEDAIQMLNLYEFSQPYKLNSVYVELSSLTKKGAQLYVVIYDSTGKTLNDGGGFVNQGSPFYKSNQMEISIADSIKGFKYLPVDVTIPPGGYYVGVELYSTGGSYNIRLAIDNSIQQHPDASLIYILGDGLYTNPNAIFLRLNNEKKPHVCDSAKFKAVVNFNYINCSFFLDTILNGQPPYYFEWKAYSHVLSTKSTLTLIPFTFEYSLTLTDSRGCFFDTLNMPVYNKYGELDHCFGIDIEEFYTNNSYTLKPNPTTGNFYIQFDEAPQKQVTVELKNALGQLVFTKRYNSNQTELPITENNLPTGIYFITIEIDNRKTTQKLIVY